MQHKFTSRTRMFNLINGDASLLSSVSRFGVSLGFGEKTVEEVCLANNIDCNTFLAVMNFLAEQNVEVNDLADNISIETVIGYLKSAHAYFLNYKLPILSTKLNEAVLDSEELHSYKVVVMEFFDEYVEEVKKHMEYEDKTVFPYVINLLRGVKPTNYRIADFEDHHTDVDSKIAELKNILIKYHPTDKVNFKLNDVLFDLLWCEKDLASHNMVEDFFFVPVVELIENKLLNTPNA